MCKTKGKSATKNIPHPPQNHQLWGKLRSAVPHPLPKGAFVLKKEQIHNAPWPVLGSGSKEADEKELRARSSWGALHAPSWAILRPPTCAGPSPHRPCGRAGRAPSAGPPSSDCSGVRTPGWGSGAAAPGNTVHRRACPTCLRNSSSFWLLGDRDPALSWSRLVSPGHWASRWWWGPGASRTNRYSFPRRTRPCLYLRGQTIRSTCQQEAQEARSSLPCSTFPLKGS